MSIDDPRTKETTDHPPQIDVVVPTSPIQSILKVHVAVADGFYSSLTGIRAPGRAARTE